MTLDSSPFPRATEAAATAALAIQVQAGSQPCLDAAEVAHLVRAARRPDRDGRSPADPAWVPTWDLAWATWKGWLLKASKAALMVDVSTPGGLSVSKSQVREACLAMAKEAARSVLQAVQVTTEASLAGDGLVSVIGQPGTTYGADGEVLPDADSLDVWGVEGPARVNGLPVDL